VEAVRDLYILINLRGYAGGSYWPVEKEDRLANWLILAKFTKTSYLGTQSSDLISKHKAVWLN
jgi:hypothetical protein